MFRAVVVGHGGFAAGLVSAVRRIAGRDEVFIPVSNEGCGPDELERRVLSAAADPSVRVVFTDLPGGSAALAARKATRTRPDLLVVTGANLAALLEFALNSTDDAAEAARAATVKGQAAIALVERR